MSVKRIPTSLKFDEDSEIYEHLILPLKTDKYLSTFLVDLLNVYYEQQDVRKLVDSYLGIHDPMEEIKNQIQRIQLEHQKSRMHIDSLSSTIHESLGVVQQAMQGQTVPKESLDNVKEENEPVVKDQTGFNQRLQGLEESMGAILDALQNNSALGEIVNPQVAVSESPVEEVIISTPTIEFEPEPLPENPLGIIKEDKKEEKEVVVEIEEPKPLNNIEEEGDFIEFSTPSSINNMESVNVVPAQTEPTPQPVVPTPPPIVEQPPVVETPVYQEPIVQQPVNPAPSLLIFDDEEEDEQEETPLVQQAPTVQEAPKVPKSFGKALGSIKKKSM